MASDEAALQSLMQASMAGDSRAHRALLGALIPVLRRYFARKGVNDADIDDLVQMTLIAVHERGDTYDPGKPFAPWVYAIARYKMIDQFRRRRNHIGLDDIGELAEERDFSEALTARLDVDAHLARIPEKQAAAVRAIRIEQLSVAETAARDGLSPSDIKISVHRGLKALAKRVLRK
ncbi:sigma-70 family RNA polymerase sigma factor [Novosphingobium piscinae]